MQVAEYDPEVARLQELAAEQDERDAAERAMMQAILGSVFSVRKPRDAVAGTASGLKTVAKGVGLGLAALVAQPYIGAKQGGAKGFVKGVGAGMLACTASTLTGTGIGTVQVIRGVMNTPRAIVQKSRGQVWNAETRTWEVDWYSLPEEAELVLNENFIKDSSKAGSSSKGSASRRPAKKVQDRTLYDLLEVQPEATDGEIRKAFYKQSLALHPDKNPDNPEATQKFQTISDAYRVLSDEDRRRAYDEHGQDSAASSLQKIEPAVFFAALFGSHHFEPWVGRLRLALELDGDVQSLMRDAASSVDEDAPSIDILKVHRAKEQLTKAETYRQVRCAVDLAARLEPFVLASIGEAAEAIAAWEAEQTLEIEKLAKTPCGNELLYLIGWMYQNRARQFFAGGVLSRIVAQVEGEMHLAHTKAQLAGAVGKSAMTMSSAVHSADKKMVEAQKDKDTQADADSPAKDKPADGAAASDQASGEAAAAQEAEEKQEAKPDAKTDAKPKSKRPGWMGFNKRSSTRSSKEDAPLITPEDPAAGVAEGIAAAAAANEPAAAKEPAAAAAKDAKASPNEGRQAAAQLPMGTVVMLTGLTGAAELNNEIGIVIQYEGDSGRYLVQVLPDIGIKKLKRENLIVFEDGPAGSPGGTPRTAEGGAAAGASASGTSAGAAGSSDGQWLPGGEEDEMADAFKDCMPLFHDAIWNVTKLDIEYTLSSVVHKVLKDMSVEKQVRRLRAEGLLTLGGLMQEPMKERRRQNKTAPAEDAAAAGAAEAAREDSPSGSSTTTGTGRKSMLERFKPRGWRPKAVDRKTQKAKAHQEKQQRMEAAIAMMAAGASTEDVDEMAAARAAMEAEFAADGYKP